MNAPATTTSDDQVSALFDCARLSGFSGTSDADLLTLVLGDPDLAKRTLAVCGDLRGLARSTPGTLSTPLRDGDEVLTERDALRLHAALELAQRARAVPISRPLPLQSSRDVVRAFGSRLMSFTEEQMLVVAIDARNRPVAETILARGGASGLLMTPGPILRFALRAGATSIIVAHNHPSGDPMPSPDDIDFTKALHAASLAAEVPLVDHVIVATGGTFSFLDTGLLKPETP